MSKNKEIVAKEPESLLENSPEENSNETKNVASNSSGEKFCRDERRNSDAAAIGGSKLDHERLNHSTISEDEMNREQHETSQSKNAVIGSLGVVLVAFGKDGSIHYYKKVSIFIFYLQYKL